MIMGANGRRLMVGGDRRRAGAGVGARPSSRNRGGCGGIALRRLGRNRGRRSGGRSGKVRRSRVGCGDRGTSGAVTLSESSGGVGIRPVALGEVQVEAVSTEDALTIRTSVGMSRAKLPGTAGAGSIGRQCADRTAGRVGARL